MGATKDPDTRADFYQTPSGGGYSGTMYYAKTDNMMKAENRLLDTALDTGGGRHNSHSVSNAKEAPGHVYVIKGKKFS